MKKDYCKEPFKYMVAIGDSITAGGSATKKEYCWVNLLAGFISRHQDNPVEFFNAGIGGNAISARCPEFDSSLAPSGIDRYRRDITGKNPDLVIIAYGTNEICYKTPVKIFLEELQLLIAGIREEINPVIVLTSTYYLPGHREPDQAYNNWGSIKMFRDYNRTIKKLAAENDTLYADIFSTMSEALWMIDFDETHPNDLGHFFITCRIFETIAANCSCLSVKSYKDASVRPSWREDSRLMNYDGIL